MTLVENSYFRARSVGRSLDRHQQALERCVARLRAVMPIVGLRNPKLGRPDNSWDFCAPSDWVISFHSGQLWLAAQLSGDPAFVTAARARRPAFRWILEHAEARDHDLGFQFSLHSVADWLMTGDPAARDMALTAARFLAARFERSGGYLRAWNPGGPADPDHSAFTAGRAIADTMQNLALLHFAHRETGIAEFREVAEAHATTTARHLVRADGTSYHTFVFDSASGQPLRGETHQGYADESCWSRGQAWLIHGFALCYQTTGNPAHLETARRLAATAEDLIRTDAVPVWDYRLPAGETPWRDSSAGAVMAAGLYILAASTSGAEAERWRGFADRLVGGLLDACDLTEDPTAHGLLAHGAAHVPAGIADAMLPYGDYYFMEALMRSLGHTQFFW